MALDILHDNWGPYTHTEVENALKLILQQILNAQEQGVANDSIGMNALTQQIKELLNKANTALQSETDPTVPSWAKQPTKPTYTAQEVGAMPAGTKIPSNTSDLNNNSGFITISQVPPGVTVDPELGDSGNAVANRAINQAINRLQAAIDALMDGESVTDAIDTFNEIKAFLNGIDTTDPTLYNQLLAINNAITALQAAINDLATIRTNAGKGVADVSSPQEDGSFTITLANGDTYTVNLNHQHAQYQPLLSSANAGSNITITTDQQGNIIISATGGGGGGGTQVQADWNQTDSTAVDFIKNKPTIPVVPTAVSSFTNDAGYITQQSLAGRVQSQDVVSIVKITQADYDALTTKDSTTLYLIPES